MVCARNHRRLRVTLHPGESTVLRQTTPRAPRASDRAFRGGWVSLSNSIVCQLLSRHNGPQLRTGLPSRWTVQSPHWAMPQPNLVPVKRRTSRMIQRRECRCPPPGDVHARSRPGSGWPSRPRSPAVATTRPIGDIEQPTGRRRPLIGRLTAVRARSQLRPSGVASRIARARRRRRRSRRGRHRSRRARSTPEGVGAAARRRACSGSGGRRAAGTACTR